MGVVSCCGLILDVGAGFVATFVGWFARGFWVG